MPHFEIIDSITNDESTRAYQQRDELVICARNEGYELDLKPLRAYEVVPDDSLEPDDIRVIDETGEDYIYPATYFLDPPVR